jgi:transcription initiation factor TFIID subunit 2
MAAQVIAASAKKDLEWIGFFHLKKAFQELFCLPGSSMTRPNDFSDRTAYLLQCAIPKAIARIKGTDGKAPMFVKRFILDLMRYNDNRGNEYSDDHYIATLMLCLAQTLTTSRRANASVEIDLGVENEEHEFMKQALEELGRHQRLDEWIPTYHNVYTTTALDCALLLMRNKAIPLKASEFLQYARVGNADNVRLKAWDCLMQVGMIRKDGIIKYIIHEICTDRSPYFRARLIRTLEYALGQVAVGEVFKVEKVAEQTNGALVIEQEDVLPDREAQASRRRLEGALRFLKTELAANEALRESLERALHSTITSVRDVAELLEISSMLYPTKNSLVVTCKLPKYWKVEHLGNGKLRFYHSGRYRDSLRKPKPVAPPVPPPSLLPPPPPQEAAPKPLKIKIKPLGPADGSRTLTPSQETPRPILVPPKPPTPLESRTPNPFSPKPSLTAPSSAPTAPVVKSPVTVAPPAPRPPPPTPQSRPQSRPPTPTIARPPASSPPAPSSPALQTAPAVPTPASRPGNIIRFKKKSTNPPPKQPKSKIVVLKISPEKLAQFPHSQRNPLHAGQKRKAERSEDNNPRALKRQLSVEPAINGGSGSPYAYAGTARPRKIVKLKIGRANAQRMKARYG